MSNLRSTLQGISLSLPNSSMIEEKLEENSNQNTPSSCELRKTDNIYARERSWTVIDITSANLLPANISKEMTQIGRSAPPDMLFQTKKIFDRSILLSSVPIDLPRLVRKIEIKNETTKENFCLEETTNPDLKDQKKCVRYFLELMADALGDKVMGEYVSNNYESVVMREDMELARALQDFFTEELEKTSICCKLLKACTQAIVAPLLTSLKLPRKLKSSRIYKSQPFLLDRNNKLSLSKSKMSARVTYSPEEIQILLSHTSLSPTRNNNNNKVIEKSASESDVERKIRKKELKDEKQRRKIERSVERELKKKDSKVKKKKKDKKDQPELELDFNSIKNSWRIQVLKCADLSYIVRHRKKERTRSNLYDEFELEWQADFVFDSVGCDLNSMFPKIISIQFSDDKMKKKVEGKVLQTLSDRIFSFSN